MDLKGTAEFSCLNIYSMTPENNDQEWNHFCLTCSSKSGERHIWFTFKNLVHKYSNLISLQNPHFIQCSTSVEYNTV